jgi:hypothetical protein
MYGLKENHIQKISYSLLELNYVMKICEISLKVFTMTQILENLNL